MNQFKCLSGGASTSDGMKAKFTLETECAAPFPVEFAHTEFLRIIDFFMRLALDAAGKRSRPTSPTFGADARIEIFPLPVEQIGITAGRTADTATLLVKLADIDFAFEFQSTKLRDLAQSFQQVAATAQANPKSVN